METIDRAWLAAHPLPEANPKGDKEHRGGVLVIAGSREMPGAAILSAVATLRAGAGKLTIVTAESVATAVATAVPEALVEGAPESIAEGLDLRHVRMLNEQCLTGYSAVLIGPGMRTPEAPSRAVHMLVERCTALPTVLDAAAMDAVAELRGDNANRLITPHAGELAHLTGRSKSSVLSDPEAAACEAAARWGILVLLKGPMTVLATSKGALWRHTSGHAGLGTSGSGDTLAGIITGIAARGLELQAAAAWGVALHARCGERLAKRIGTLGYLARELVDEVPCAAMDLTCAVDAEG